MATRRVPLAIAALAVGTMTLTGCTLTSNEPDQAAVVYDGEIGRAHV